MTMTFDGPSAVAEEGLPGDPALADVVLVAVDGRATGRDGAPPQPETDIPRQTAVAATTT
jgi:hypothetical protein